MDPMQNQFDGSVQDQMAPEGPNGEGTQPIDPQYVAQLERQRDEASRMAAAAQAEAARLSVQRANEAYEAEKRRLLEEKGDDPAAIAAFYEERDRAKDLQMQAAFAGALVNGYRNDLQQRYGLTPDQVDLLGEDPNRMEQRARTIAQQNQQALQFQQTVDQAFLGQQAHERVMSNADRIGGSRGGQGRPAPTYEKGSMDHLRDLMFGDGQRIIP